MGKEREFYTTQLIRRNGKKIPAGQPITLSDDKEIESLKANKAITDDPAGDDQAFEPVNINEADRDTLLRLPGIHEETADAILKSREREGAFKSLGDLTRVKGIGEGTVNGLGDVATAE